MIGVTSSFYKEKMGNISSITKSPVTKPTSKSSDLKQSHGSISDSVNHVSSSDLKSSSSSSISSVKGGDSKTSDHRFSGSNSSSTTFFSEEEEEESKKLPIDDSKTSKEPNNCETKSDLQGTSEENSKALEEKGNNVKVTTIPITSSLNQWNDYQQPSTSKAKVITFLHNTQKDIPSEETEEEETETFSEGDFDDEEYEVHYDSQQFSPQVDNNNQDSFIMTKNRSSNKFNVEDDMDDDDQFYDENDGYKAIGDLSKLLEHLVSHNGMVGPRSRKTICDDSDSDSDYENSNGPANNLTPQIMPTTIPKEDLGELGIPRTQKITKNGDPVVEKCKCHHHQIVTTKCT